MTKGHVVHPGVPGREGQRAWGLGRGRGGDSLEVLSTTCSHGIPRWRCGRQSRCVLTSTHRGFLLRPVRRPSGLFSWSARSMGLTATLMRPVVTPPAWHCPALGVAERALCCGPRASEVDSAGICPLCGPHCGPVMSTSDSHEQPKSCAHEGLSEPRGRLGIHSPPRPSRQGLTPSPPQAEPHPSSSQQAGSAPPAPPPRVGPHPPSCPRQGLRHPEHQLSSGWKSITRSCPSAACHTASLTGTGRGLHEVLHKQPGWSAQACFRSV